MSQMMTRPAAANAFSQQPQTSSAASSAPLKRAIGQGAVRWGLIAFTLMIAWSGYRNPNGQLHGVYRFAEYILAYMILDPFVIAPVVLMSKLKHKAKGDYFPLALNEIPASVRDTARFAESIRELERLGFEPAGYAGRTTKQAKLYLATFIHPRNSDCAAVAFAQSALFDRSLVCYWTRFEDGTSLDSSNYPEGGLFYENPEHPTYRFPQIHNVAQLYAAHRALLGRRTSSSRAIQLKPEKMIWMLDDATEREFSYQAKRGVLVLGASGEQYGYTWKGAFRHAILSAWWVKPLRRIRNEARATRLMRDLGLLVDSGRGGMLRPDLDNRPLG